MKEWSLASDWEQTNKCFPELRGACSADQWRWWAICIWSGELDQLHRDGNEPAVPVWLDQLYLINGTVMVVMSQLYLCDEPYWSRFHSPPGALSQPTVHVISDGKIFTWLCCWWMAIMMKNDRIICKRFLAGAIWAAAFIRRDPQCDLTWHDTLPCQHGTEWQGMAGNIASIWRSRESNFPPWIKSLV